MTQNSRTGGIWNQLPDNSSIDNQFISKLFDRSNYLLRTARPQRLVESGLMNVIINNSNSTTNLQFVDPNITQTVPPNILFSSSLKLSNISSSRILNKHTPAGLAPHDPSSRLNLLNINEHDS